VNRSDALDSLPGRSGIERPAPHLVAYRDDRSIRQRPALPIGPVDDEGMPGDEPGEGRGEEGRGPAELLHSPDRSAGWQASFSLVLSRLPLMSAVMSSCGKSPGTNRSPGCRMAPFHGERLDHVLHSALAAAE